MEEDLSRDRSSDTAPSYLLGHELADLVPDWVVVFDEEGGIRYANRSFREFLENLGPQPGEWSLHGSVYPEDRPQFVQRLGAMWASGSTVDATVRMAAVNGCEVSVRWHARAGSVMCQGQRVAVGIGRDVTELLESRIRLENRVTCETMLSGAARRLSSMGEGRLHEVLRIAGQAMHADRVYVFQINPESETMNNTYEWCAQGVAPAVELLQDLPLDQFPWWMRQLRANKVIAVSDILAMSDEQSAEQAILRAQGIQSVLCLPLRGREGELAGFIGFDSVFARRAWEGDDIRALRVLSELVSAWQERRASMGQSVALQDALIDTLSSIVEIRDPYTHDHQRHVAQLAHAIAETMNLGQSRSRTVYVAGLLHDIGKLMIPAGILAKPGSLSTPEMALVQSHAEKGFAVLSRIPFGEPVADMVRQHHERMDGSGYPDGLSGDEILLEARILAVADVVEAITHHRPYRPARSLHAALDDLAAGSGHLFDEPVVDACFHVLLGGGFRFSGDSSA